MSDREPSLEELRRDKKVLEDKLKDINDQIASHSSHKEKLFVGIPKGHPLLSRIGKIKEDSGWTDSRKNPVKWSGFEFELDGEKYEVRKGSNWCSDVFDVRKIGEWMGKSLNYSWRFPEEEEDFQYIYERMNPILLVAHVLMWNGGYYE